MQNGFGVSYRKLNLRARAGKQDEPEHFILPESKEVLKEWGYIKINKGESLKGFPKYKDFL